jgi:hypothetical protein
MNSPHQYDDDQDNGNSKYDIYDAEGHPGKSLDDVSPDNHRIKDAINSRLSIKPELE